MTSSVSTHVPGPWAVAQPSADGNSSAHIEIHDPFGRTATVYGEVDDEETQCTARLIAAAPDLLAALQAEQEWCERAYDGTLDPEWDYETMVGDLRRAALAKVIGGAA
jgi:hypothetical protein